MKFVELIPEVKGIECE